jgi:class 3 adenylate cyclase
MTGEAETAEIPDGERKTVTALFADIKGSTELMEDLDPEAARAIIDPVLKLMMEAVHRYDGYVVQSTGDGIFALFGAPLAHEDHPQRALHAAIAMRDELRRRGEELTKQGKSGVEIRIGINTGEMVLRTVHTGGHTEYIPVADAANLAARMQSIAPAGSSDRRRHAAAGRGLLRTVRPWGRLLLFQRRRIRWALIRRGAPMVKRMWWTAFSLAAFSVFVGTDGII